MTPGGVVMLQNHPWFPALVIRATIQEALVSHSQILEFEVLTVLCPDQQIRTFTSLDFADMSYSPPANYLYTDQQDE